jgi:hypothetical protein
MLNINHGAHNAISAKKLNKGTSLLPYGVKIDFFNVVLYYNITLKHVLNNL